MARFADRDQPHRAAATDRREALFRMAAVNQASGTAETCSFAVAAIFTGDTQPSIRAKRLD
jgi:hypothetical protein